MIIIIIIIIITYEHTYIHTFSIAISPLSELNALVHIHVHSIYYPAIRAATRSLRRIHLQFWRADAVIQRAYHG